MAAPGAIEIWRQTGRRRHLAGNDVGQRNLLEERAIKKFDEHVIPLVFVADFLAAQRPCDQEMQMILIHELRIIGVAPWLGVEMKADDHVRADDLIDQVRPSPDFCHAIKEPFAFLAEAFLVIGNALIRQRFSRNILELIHDEVSRGSRFAARQEDLRSEFFEARGQKFRDREGHVPFSHRRRVADLKPPLLHPRPISSDMTWIQSNLQAGERFGRLFRRNCMRLRQYLGIDLAASRDGANRNENGGPSGRVVMIAISSCTTIVSFHAPAGA